MFKLKAEDWGGGKILEAKATGPPDIEFGMNGLSGFTDTADFSFPEVSEKIS